MAIAPSIFISAPSGDLHTARDLVAKILTSLGYNPVWQDIAATEAGILSDVLRSWIKPCAAVIQLVGFRYGAEPREPDPQFGRASYTQLEAMYAERMGKKVIYIFLPPEFPADPCEPEPDEKAKLQLAYRQRLEDSGVLRHNATSPLELENRVLRIRDELAILRAEMEKSRRRLWWIAAFVIILLIGIGFGVWHLSKSSGQQKETLLGLKKTGEDQTRLLSGLDVRIREIQSLSAPARADRLDHALASANSEDLFLLKDAGITASEIEESLHRKLPGTDDLIAASFFKFSKRNERAIDWLKVALKSGLDPNMTLPDSYFEQQAILIPALKAANVPAVLALLDAGASPHPYQNLFLTSYEMPRFLFPYWYLFEDERLTAEEKHQLAKAYQRAGAAIFRFKPGVPHTRGLGGGELAQVEEIEKVFSGSHAVFGSDLEETPPIPRAAKPSFLQHVEKNGGPWTKFVREMPTKLTSEGRNNDGPLWIEVRNFIGIYSDHAYFLGAAQDQLDPEYALIEISRDAANWSIYLFIGTRGGMGFAKEEGDGGSSSYHRDAWRRFDMKYSADKREITWWDYYKYKATRDLSPR